MLDKTRLKYLIQGLRELEKLAVKRREVVERDNKDFYLTNQERFMARGLANETSAIFKGLKLAYFQAGIEYKPNGDDLDAQTDYIQATTSEQIAAFNIEAFVVRKALLKDAAVKGNKPGYIAPPRGNPQKGGLVKKLVSQGYGIVEANQKADEMIELGSHSVVARDKGFEPYVPIELPKDGFLSKEEAMAVVLGHTPAKKTTSILDILNASEEELLEKYGSGDKIKPEIDLGNIDQSDAPEF